MTFFEFTQSLISREPPEGLEPVVKALWYERKGDWHKAHQIVQELPERNGSWVHAYLHRVEGELWNARYWYSRAGVDEAVTSTDEEWEAIVRTLL